MNKLYSKKELKAKALDVFEQYPSEDKVFAREDGNIFFNENMAELERGKMKVYPFEKRDIVEVDQPIGNSYVSTEIVATEIKPGAPVNESVTVTEAKTDAPVTPVEQAPVQVDAPLKVAM